MSEEKPKCDLDDLVCQMQVLGHLKGIKTVLGEEKFKTGFSEFEGLDAVLTEKITAGETTLKEALEKCGLSEVEEIIVKPESVIIEEE